MILIDRQGKEHKINTVMIKDASMLGFDIYKACHMLTLNNLRTYIIQYKYESNLKENKEALDKLLSYMCDDTAVFDLVMTKQALTWFMGINRYYDNVPPREKEEVNTDYATRFLLNAIKGADKMLTTLTVGTTITDRNGKEFKAYSYLINEYFEAMELLTKVDMANISNNIGTDDDSFAALMEILYRTFDRKIPKEEILESLDAEFARKAIKVYYDII